MTYHSFESFLIDGSYSHGMNDLTWSYIDAVVTFSSVEHSGLGRFGYMLYPWGDIIIISRAWCVANDGGYLTIGVPYDFDNEYIRFNGDRGKSVIHI